MARRRLGAMPADAAGAVETLDRAGQLRRPRQSRQARRQADGLAGDIPHQPMQERPVARGVGILHHQGVGLGFQHRAPAEARDDFVVIGAVGLGDAPVGADRLAGQGYAASFIGLHPLDDQRGAGVG